MNFGIRRVNILQLLYFLEPCLCRPKQIDIMPSLTVYYALHITAESQVVLMHLYLRGLWVYLVEISYAH